MSTTAKWLIVAFGIAFFCIVGLIVVDRYPRFRHFFGRNHKVITILLTAVGLVVGLSAVYAARDAANAAKEQVILQTYPFVGTAPRPLRGFAYKDGRQLAGNHPSPYDVAIVGSTFYGAVALENIGPGFAVIHLTRWGAFDEIIKEPYREPPVRPRPRPLLGPFGRRSGISLQYILPVQLVDRDLVRAIRSGRGVAFQAFFSDLSGDLKRKVTIVLERQPGTRFWGSIDEPHQDHWNPGIEARP